jgi:hypothetical protein
MGEPSLLVKRLLTFRPQGVPSFITADTVDVLRFVTLWSKRKELLAFYGVAIRAAAGELS